MECNRDEAMRAKSIAEGKLEQKNFFGAKKFALKAHALYPGLDGISQMLTTLDVYVSAENKISGEIDWYGVLAVDPCADDETIKKQYRKLALMLHPDKNKSIGADGAFKLISEAWTLLSDKTKRLAYNQRRGLKAFQQKPPMHSGGPSTKAGFAPQAHAGFGPSVHSYMRPASAQTGFVPSAQTGFGPSSHTGGTAAPTSGPSVKTGGPSAPSRASPSFGSASKKTAAPKTQRKSAKPPSAPAPPPATQRTDTFWTICHLCSIQYEYLRMYRNCTLRCSNCAKPFVALETTPPRISKSTKPGGSWQGKQKPTDNVTSQNAFGPGTNVSAAQNSGPGPAGQNSSTYANSQAQQVKPGQNSSTYVNSQAQQVKVPQAPVFGKASNDNIDPSIPPNDPDLVEVQDKQGKKRRYGRRASTAPERSTKKRKVGDGSTTSGRVPDMAQGNVGFGTTSGSGLGKVGSSGTYNHRNVGFDTTSGSGSRNFGFPGTNHHVNAGFQATSGSGPRNSGFSGTCHQRDSTRELTLKETQKLLMVKAKREILEKLSKSSSETTAKAEYEEKDKTKESNKERSKTNSSSQRQENNGKNLLSATKMAENHGDSGSEHDASKQCPEAVMMDVPDPDFHDFDVDRSASSFADNEVWATYDDGDGMPRFYVLINEVISRDPFQLRISWLNSTTTTEFSNIDWVGSGFHKTCGEFSVGRSEEFNFINSFSQRVHWSKGPHGGVLILPQKDDVWALYREWSSDWDENTPSEAMYKYDMVMVLDDYIEEQGVHVAPLLKVVGFRTVFRPNLDPQARKRIPREEMLRFSHRVPTHLLTGQEGKNAPEGCLELDPAATPLELLKKQMGRTR